MFFLKDEFEILRKLELDYDSRVSYYSFGFIYECFVCKNEVLFSILDYINENINELDDFFNEILRANLINKLKVIKKEANDYLDKCERDNFISFELVRISNEIKDSKLNSLEEFLFNQKDRYKDSYQGYMDDSKEKGHNFSKDFIDLYNPLRMAFDVFYTNYKSKINKMNFSVSDYKTPKDVKRKLESIYGKNALDRYDLLKITDNHFIYNYEINYVKDNWVEKNYFITAVNKKTLEIIKKIREEDFADDVSFQIILILDDSLGLEDKGRGVHFDYNLSKLHDISQFYNVSNEAEQLFVFVGKEKSKISLTFETLVPDFLMDKDCNVLTNMIHLEVSKDENRNDVISHIDHEYIVYSAEEYDRRLEKDPRQRGHDKIKTFKIDNAKIPLNYTIDGAPILYCFLLSCLDNKELIDEYFNKVFESE
ncbi:hypothetical protein ABFP33_20420 [Acinetobacter bereziniae]|uniref:hypothetical protein n=1 Tax=Acinetobacter bereziniae TaxID=106648 RepID=UPI00321295D6